MGNIFNQPSHILVISFIIFWAASLTGYWLGLRAHKMGKETSDDLKLVLGGALTLLGLIVGFTFSMAVSRYDLRQVYEEGEANAIETEYERADLLPAAEAMKVRGLLTNYLEQRIRNYESRDGPALQQIKGETDRLQNQMWSVVSASSTAHPTPVAALAVAGMNDVSSSRGNTQAAWWNRVPPSAWTLLAFISISCNALIGYVARQRSTLLLVILPIALAVSFCFIADIDRPRGGWIRVQPQNLQSVAESLRAE